MLQYMFSNSQQEQMAKDTQVLSAPLIDLAQPGAATLAALDSACRNFGFFHISGHGIPQQLLDDTLAQMARFFALPSTRKRQILRSAENPWGFFDAELTKNNRDAKEILDIGPATQLDSTWTPQWPADMDGFRETMENFARAVHKVGLTLVEMLANNLGASPATLTKDFGDAHTSFLRLNYYPKCNNAAAPDAPTEPSSGAFGIHNHTDAGAVTVLLQDQVPGLQFLHNGAWRTLTPRAGALVVNIGDIVQVWSNDRYPAPEHRVLASSGSPRYSAPYFLNPSFDATYEPLPASIATNSPRRYRTINWGEFRAARAAGDFANYGNEIQISDFKA